ncbi:MAG: metal ABC transporter substrate-binding protein [Solirubrobacterales bacterium]
MEMPSAFPPRGAQPAPVVLAVLVLAALLLPACSADRDPGGAPSVVATTGVAADITRQLAGPGVEVSQLVPDGSSPHNYSASARERGELDEADLVVYFSTALEQGLPIEDARRSFAFADHAAELRSFADDELESGIDPHLWLDPTQITAALPALADALAQVDPGGADGYRRRAAAYAARLSRLDGELERMVASIPPDSRKLVTSHDSMGYFADRYGFEFVGAPFGAAPEAAASAGELGELIEQVADAEAVAGAGVPAIFAQEGDDPEILRQVAAEAGVEVVDDLRVTDLGASESYIEMMRFTTARITEALGGRT